MPPTSRDGNRYDRLMQPRRHRMRKQARRESARAWIRSGARVTVKTYAKWYDVDRHTAYEDLTAIKFPLPADAARWAQRPPATPRHDRRRTDDLDDERFGDPDWVWVGDRWMFVVGHTPGGAPFGCYEDEFNDVP
jgi:hypothetical protein